MKNRDLLSVADISSEEMEKLIVLALTMKRRAAPKLLKDKILVLLFEKPSLRTRVSFEVGIRQLGGSCIYLSPEEVGLGKREPVADVARILSRYVHGIIARTFAHETLQALVRYATVPVINALSDMEHPCQALADILTIREKRGKLKGLTLAYIGDGNNVARSLVLAGTLTGLNVNVASPQGHEVDKNIMDVLQIIFEFQPDRFMEKGINRPIVIARFNLNHRKNFLYTFKPLLRIKMDCLT